MVSKQLIQAVLLLSIALTRGYKQGKLQIALAIKVPGTIKRALFLEQAKRQSRSRGKKELLPSVPPGRSCRCPAPSGFPAQAYSLEPSYDWLHLGMPLPHWLHDASKQTCCASKQKKCAMMQCRLLQKVHIKFPRHGMLRCTRSFSANRGRGT